MSLFSWRIYIIINKSKDIFSRTNSVLSKNYRHFDKQLSYDSANNFINKTVLNKRRVSEYRFLPLIIFKKQKVVYRRSHRNLNSSKKIKNRPISLVAHHDAIIYAYYSNILSNYYEHFILENNFSNVPTAYRRGLHLSNISSSKEIFNFIIDSKKSWIIKGDFKGFFDNIKHGILYKNLCRILKVKRLSPDWYAIFKSLTKYRYTDKKSIITAMKKCGINNNHTSSYTKDKKEIGKLVSKGDLKLKGPNNVGIPQGTSLSAVLANVYMIDFDKEINEIINKKNGIYRRYSDDFIIVIPKNQLKLEQLKTFVNQVIILSKEKTHLEIEKNKTKVFAFDENNNQKIELLKLYKQNQGSKYFLDYLGFVFDGDIVRMRNKSVYRFHYKSKRAIKLSFRTVNDRKKLSTNNLRIPNTKNHMRAVWKKKEHILENTKQIPKQQLYKKRMLNVKKNIKYNNTQKKMTVKMYLISQRYGEKYSMIGYAKRAQKILQNNNNRYKVDVLRQINKQIINNQLMVHNMKRHFKNRF